MCKVCVLIDASNLMYKYLHIYSNLSVPAKKTLDNGEEIHYNKPTGHIYGLCDFITGTRDSNPNIEFILAFDGKSPRRDLSDSYKDRMAFDEAYSVGKENNGRYNVHNDRALIIKMLGALKNVYFLFDENLEADDLIYNYIHQYKDNYDKIYIISEDRDLLINVDDKVTQYKKLPKGTVISNVNEDIVYDLETVKNAYFGLYGNYLITYKSLVGDASDNIKGYDRIPKKVAGYLARYMKVKENRVIVQKEQLDENIDKETELANYLKEYKLKEKTIEKWLDNVKSDRNRLLQNYVLVAPFIKEISLLKLDIALDNSIKIAKKYKMNRLYQYLLNEKIN